MNLPLRAPALAALILFTISTGLAIDIAFGVPGQIAVTLWVWGVLTWLCLKSTDELRVRLIACVWISGIGEIGASLIWRLYDYQFGNVPLFVPPGHALLYLLGIIVAERLPARTLAPSGAPVRTLAPSGAPDTLSALVPILAAPVVAYLAWTGADTLSLALFFVFIVFMLFGPEKKLYATMFMIALAMELYGTALGNWTWREQVRATSLTTLNPPLAAGVFYCLLDWLVGWRSAVYRRGAMTPGRHSSPRSALTLSVPLAVPSSNQIKQS